MNDLSTVHSSKFQSYRKRKKAAGLREVRMWVPDVSDPAVREQLDREIAAINRSHEADLQNALEAAAAEVWNLKG